MNMTSLIILIFIILFSSMFTNLTVAQEGNMTPFMFSKFYNPTYKTWSDLNGLNQMSMVSDNGLICIKYGDRFLDITGTLFNQMTCSSINSYTILTGHSVANVKVYRFRNSEGKTLGVVSGVIGLAPTYMDTMSGPYLWELYRESEFIRYEFQGQKFSLGGYVSGRFISLVTHPDYNFTMATSPSINSVYEVVKCSYESYNTARFKFTSSAGIFPLRLARHQEHNRVTYTIHDNEGRYLKATYVSGGAYGWAPLSYTQLKTDLPSHSFWISNDDGLDIFDFPIMNC